ncbi:MAG: ParB N-terminal domain-containing protein [Alistipes sp.]|nr:ParB N-terminal domain-containing protein [Alistipes sp.]
MTVQHTMLPLAQLERNEGQIAGLPSNPREWSKAEIEKLKKSIRQTPELLEARGLIVYPHNSKYVILGGNMRFTALSEMKIDNAPCIVLPEGLPLDKLKEIVIKDNGSFGSWGYDALANEWDDLPLTDWGVPAWNAVEEDATDYEAKMQEMRDRLEAGEIREEDEEYQAFLAKFEAAKTTDDCYTPELVYEAVAKWVEDEYGVKRDNFVRPFFPGGDYQNEKYPKGAIVVDNPPFSILAEIITFYKERNIKFFLFAPALTLFSSSSSSSCTCLPLNVGIIYANGANVCTSFVTNLEDEGLRLRSAPTLYTAIFEANKENMKQQKKELPKYSYPPHLITASFVGALSRYGIDFSVPVNESECVSQLDSQKDTKKAIFGRGYIISDLLKAEREKAEREKAEREKAERWELSEREREIIRKLNNKLGQR